MDATAAAAAAAAYLEKGFCHIPRLIVKCQGASDSRVLVKPNMVCDVNVMLLGYDGGYELRSQLPGFLRVLSEKERTGPADISSL